MKTILLTLILAAGAPAAGELSGNRISSDELKIAVDGPSREIAYTNKEAGYYYTETNGPHRTGWQGWHIMSVKILDDYRIVAGGDTLRREQAHAEVLPHQMTRLYPGGTTETFTMLDSVDALVVELRSLRASLLRFSPLFAESPHPEDYVVRWDHRVLLIALKRHLRRTASENYPVWIGISAAPPITALRYEPDSPGTAAPWSPADLIAEPWHDRCTFVLAAGDSATATAELARQIAESYPGRIAARERRIEQMLNRSMFRCNDENYTRAVNWAKVSADALIMNQLKKGIFAGLPWFDNYWGRDSYISLPGTALVTGDFAEAKQILNSFAGWQDTNRQSPTWGRIPNIVTPVSIAYNTADGTPWFTIAAEEYVRMSGDTGYVPVIYPAVRLGIGASIARRCDRYGFLTHADAETWMDAVGPEGPWSPRGNRADDIQELWYRQLRAGARFARMVGDSGSASAWDGRADSLRTMFNRMFIDADSAQLYDHLNADGSPDRRIRPNQIFALGLIQDPVIRANVFRKLTERLVYSYGVGSLWQEDPGYHPWHHYEPYYVQDAAYHNGVVWTWLAGRWIDEAAGYGLPDLAFTVTASMTRQILERGAVGTISELLDGAPRPGESEPGLSGTFSQAWSLAEYIRVLYEAYLGIRTDAVGDRISITPHLPGEITEVSCTIPVGTRRVGMLVHDMGGRGDVRFTLDTGEVPLRLDFGLGNRRSSCTLLPGKPLRITFDEDGLSVAGTACGDPATIPDDRASGPVRGILAGIRLAVPHVRADLPALRRPSYRALTHEEVSSVNPQSKIIYDAPDPEGDDRGPGSYTYPATPALLAGSLDITHFTAAYDGRYFYFRLTFRNLSNPGWHPEYGFQLTFAAIAVHTGDAGQSVQRVVGRNAHYFLDSSLAFSRIVYIGGGISVEDGKGAILAEYRPVAGDEKKPLGDVASHTISCAVPGELLGAPDARWKFSVLIGAQDDHGGAGVGEFRAVGAEAGEWIGGGKSDPAASNIYDVLLPQDVRR
ncbi:MAG TPA: amylo-alpha-1,6-glucosidase [Bacteroidota bacterium]|nr:amylo-alpha-1,6-glucosidase [Bacteroidota bacterium]